jgi:glycerol uptake facilitator-like aquaporin
VIERACALRTAKGIVSLAWKAGLTVQTAIALQVALAHLPPDMTLRPAQDGGFPLSEEEMRWQLGFLAIPDRGLRAWTPRRLAE